MVGAGLVRIVLDKRRFLAYPLDAYRTYRGRRVFGDSKTVGGALILILFSGFFGLITLGFARADTPSWYGLALGVAYQLGELLNSFAKRQRGLAPGRSLPRTESLIQYLVDSYDGIILMLPLARIWGVSLGTSLVLVLLGGLIHIAIDSLNHVYFSKTRADKMGIIIFYQWLGYILLTPLLLVVTRRPTPNIAARAGRIVLTMNHPFFGDALLLLRALPWRDFRRLVPFRYVVHDSHYSKWYLQPLFKLTGGLNARWEDFYAPKPFQILTAALDAEYSILLPYEGRRTRTARPPETLGYGLYRLVAQYDVAFVPYTVRPHRSGWAVDAKPWPNWRGDSKIDFYACLNNTLYETPY